MGQLAMELDGLSERSSQVLELASEEAHRLGHEFVGTEHLLLGILGEGGAAAELLLAEDVELESLREAVGEPGEYDLSPVVSSETLPLTTRARSCLRRAAREAGRHGGDEIEPEHLLLALLEEEDGVAAGALLEEGLELDELRDDLEEILGGEEADEEERARALPSEKSIRALFEVSGLEIPPEFLDYFEKRSHIDRLEEQIRDLRAEKEKAVKDEKYERAAQVKEQLEELETARKEIAQAASDLPSGLSVESMLLRQNRRVIELLEAILDRFDKRG